MRASVYRVNLQSESYEGHRETRLLKAKNMAEAEKRAVAAANKEFDDNRVCGDKKGRFYATSIELIGELDA